MQEKEENKPTRVPTFNQRKAAKKLVDALSSGKKIDGGDILENVGYTKSIAKNPKIVFQSKGFQEALRELGFSVNAADMTIAKILRTGKEENQIKASQEIYKRLGAYSQPGQQNTTNIVIIPSEVAKRHGINISPSPSPSADSS